MSETTSSACPSCATCEADGWRVRGALLRLELRRHDLSFREMIIAELILDKTYGWQRAAVVFPQLRYFTDLTGIGAPDVVKVLKTLHARRVIRIQTIKGRPNYSLNPNTDDWKALPRVDKATMQAMINLMREQNDLEPIHIEQEAALNFKNHSQAEKPAAGIGDLPMGEQTDEFPNLF